MQIDWRQGGGVRGAMCAHAVESEADLNADIKALNADGVALLLNAEIQYGLQQICFFSAANLTTMCVFIDVAQRRRLITARRHSLLC